ncbi:MAG TPA: PQQ-binding-like beta-propeller repeat protein [Ignavibacteriaceae bacterium]|nr:PQQ-binding-like beta-propeller repeat protein [Ignavibacteriaceae bacterium]
MIKNFTVALSIILMLSGMTVAQINNPTIFSDWNNGGGNPQRNGLSDLDGPLTDSLFWEVNSGSLIGFPVYIEGNKLITMKFLQMTNAPVVCYDLRNGQLLWEKEVTGLAGRSLPLGIRDGQVYVMRLTESGVDSLYALNATNGEKVWTANVTINTYVTESISFAPNGDLLVNGSNFKMYRINYLTGQKVWETNIIGIASGSGEMVAYENTGYVIKQIGGVAYLQAINLDNGQQKYDHIINETHPGGPLQQCGFMVGPDGIIYVHKQGDNVTALQDNGSGLSVLWETEIFGSAPFSLMCIGSDGSIYAPSSGRIIRLDPTDGQKLDSTAVIANPDLFQLRPSASANGVIYATTGESNIYAYNLDLQELWTDAISNVNTSGVAIGLNGLIAVAGSNKIKVYTAGNPVSVEEELKPDGFELSQNYPNPFNPSTTIKYSIPTSEFVTLKIYDVLGNEVGTLVNEEKPAGSFEVEFEAAELSSGIYFYTLQSGSFIQTKKLVLIK